MDVARRELRPSFGCTAARTRPAADGGLPVTIGSGSLPPFDSDVLLNLDSCVPEGFDRFARVAEVVGGGEPARSEGRERFRRYRAHGCELRTHRL